MYKALLLHIKAEGLSQRKVLAWLLEFPAEQATFFFFFKWNTILLERTTNKLMIHARVFDTWLLDDEQREAFTSRKSINAQYLLPLTNVSFQAKIRILENLCLPI